MTDVRKIVFIAAGPDWGRHPCSLSHIMTVLMRRAYPVIWINSLAQRAPRLSRQDLVRAVHKAVAALRTKQSEGVTGPLVVHPRAVPYHQFAPVRSVNGWLITRQLRPVLARFADHKVVLVATNPAAVALANSLHPDATLYFCMDDYARMKDSDSRLIEVCERLMLARADATIVTAKSLVEAKTYAGRIPVYIPQGVDVAHFATPGPLPEHLAQIPRPVIGFQGILGPRVDIDLLEKIAKRFPKVSLVLVGKEEVDLRRLKALPNVYVLGAVPYDALPSWIQLFDVGLVAYRYDGHTESVNPLKLLEYLALGQEVVSVDLPELAQHQDMVHVATDHTSYLAALDRVLRRYPFTKADRARRMRYAREHAWDERATRLLDLCDRLLTDADINASPPYGSQTQSQRICP